MKEGLKTNEKGFTIIEVVLVLAIAGLIFLVVFLALPALQRSQRDTQRRADTSRAMSQIAAYQSNRQGNVPANQADLDNFKSDYLTTGGQQFKDPYTGSDYTLTYQPLLTTAVTTVGQIFYYTNATCDSSAASGVVAGSGSRNVSLVAKVEQGGLYCLNN